MPLYLKDHSYGEYVFDWAWADAYHRHGIAYYPKLLSAIPFTPVTGARLLAATDEDRDQLIEAALDLARKLNVSSLHCLFPTRAEAQRMRAHGMMPRTTVQFHWMNQGYASFEAFLAGFSHDKRKKVKQERRKTREAGIRCKWLEGDEIAERDWAFFHRCYRANLSRAPVHALSQPRFLLPHRQAPCRSISSSSSPNVTVSPSPPRSTSAIRAGYAADIGARCSTIPRCISRLAITRASSTASRAASPRSKAARAASTSWRGG